MATGLNCTNNICCFFTWSGSSNNLYCHLTIGSNNCFGCSSVRNKEYCVLNKQYSKAEYEALVPKIIEHMKSTGEWGEFFPPELSPFSFDETVANEWYPIEKSEATKRGYRWEEKETRGGGSKSAMLPNTIDEVSDSIATETLYCRQSGKQYRIIPQELEIYRKLGIPLPELGPDERFRRRLARRNPRRLHARACSSCKQTIQTTYPPEDQSRVFCETCYQREVYA